ncbi:MAG: hypothetical protein WBP18_05645, partial [Paracoccaceae bacterium]
MLLRIVLFLGLGLVLAGFGAAGWQYWQSLPAASDVVVVEEPAAEEGAAPPEQAEATPDEVVIEPGQNWLISETGGLVPRRDVRVFLQQSKFVKDRRLTFRLRAPLSALLSPGEALPDKIYQEAFAEVRASAVAKDLCVPLLNGLAEQCALASAQMDDDSYDPATETAVFRLVLVYTLKPGADPLPDLGTRSLRIDTMDVDLTRSKSPQALLEKAVAQAGYACVEGFHCRLMNMDLSWDSPDRASGRMTFGGLIPLPEG